MKKTLTTLSAAALILAATGCTTGTEEGGDFPSTAGSPAASSAASGTAGSPTASPVALAEGFPSNLIPVMEGSDLLSSTVDRSGATLTAVLVESSDAPAAEILAFYDAKLVAQGFTAAEAAPGSPASRDYVRTGSGEPETVNITTVAKDGGKATVTVGASVLAETVK
ncbi:MULTISPECIES: hypothetical protein [unclassified Arthrobacter]|uniref:hypothetical protein n=1 Tax=unclassified Arthrobacter TaxID=235627 RepID=UPI001E325B2B|nr:MULTISPECIES: hypothetical protein [unclassified Arthrobacter]MCC9145025.1 hypothetical protein [Arthrobacter sp. zg-Y919]MDK1276253.1 hypothetical protein [Arthrobacter sp. zg.Y919]WIB02139.1 hypothetical protein QNO10_09125 [Arthrobacter sp. zg-Y919]